MSTQQISSSGQADKFLSNNGSGPIWRPTSLAYTQSIPDTVWTINHNLGKFPSLRLKDMNQNTIQGDVNDIDSNNLTITFISPKSGFAYLN